MNKYNKVLSALGITIYSIGSTENSLASENPLRKTSYLHFQLNLHSTLSYDSPESSLADLSEDILNVSA